METMGGVLIRGLWDRHIDAIIDVKLGNADTDTYRFALMVTLMDIWDKMKKYKHERHCHKQHKPFSMFLLSVDGILDRRAQIILAFSIGLMTVKTEESILHIKG